MADAAVQFAETLSDSVRASQLEELYKELKSKIKSQELNKNYLEKKLKDELDEIERQRDELDKREREAISTMVTEDEANMQFIGSLLEGRLRNILCGDNTDDDLNGSDPNDQPENNKAETTDENPSREKSSKEAESPKLVLNGINSSDETEGEDIPADTAKRDSADKGNSGGFQYIKLPLSTSRKSGKYEDDLAEQALQEEASPGEAPFAE